MAIGPSSRRSEGSHRRRPKHPRAGASGQIRATVRLEPVHYDDARSGDRLLRVASCNKGISSREDWTLAGISVRTIRKSEHVNLLERYQFSLSEDLWRGAPRPWRSSDKPERKQTRASDPMFSFWQYSDLVATNAQSAPSASSDQPCMKRPRHLPYLAGSTFRNVRHSATDADATKSLAGDILHGGRASLQDQAASTCCASL